MRVLISRAHTLNGVRYKSGTRPIVPDDVGARLCKVGHAINVTDLYPAADVVIEPHSARHHQTARH